MQAAFAQVGPLLMGLQVGALVGSLGKHALGRHDLPVPRDDDGHLFFVAPNVDGVASDYGFDAERFRMWLALREVARHLVISSVPWLARYHKGLLLEVADTIEVDVSDLERRLGELGAGGLEALGQGMAPEGMLPLVPTERHRRAVARLRAFLALFEGYAAHAVGAVSSEIVGDTARIDEGMARRRASSGEAETLLADLLGISRSKTLEASGSTFCAAVVKLKGPGVLNRVWDAPDNLPSEEEIRDPFAWLERQGL
jgi:putative hydrolase